MITKEKPSKRGGKRVGAGRPKSGRIRPWMRFKLSVEAADVLEKVNNHSEFVDKAILMSGVFFIDRKAGSRLRIWMNFTLSIEAVKILDTLPKLEHSAFVDKAILMHFESQPA